MRRVVVVAGLCVATVVASTAPAFAAPGRRSAGRSLPHVSGGARPGPSILYAKPAHSPQLENVGIWHAKPILISGTTAYRDGEWMYQDYLYDDHGALGTPDPSTPYPTVDFLFSPPAGTYTYPTSRVYDDNAADLVEFRTKPLAHSTAFRVTLNTMHKASLVGFTIALGDKTSPTRSWPDKAGVSGPASRFLTVHGTHAVLTDAATGKQITPRSTVSVSVKRRQFDVRIPHAAWNPKHSTVRTTIGVGLWDTKANHYLQPNIGPATKTTPGGGSATKVAIVNAGPRNDEPWPDIREPTETIGDTAAGGIAESAMWREHHQADKLALGSVADFAAYVNYDKLAHKVTDNRRVPTSGAMDRIMVSHFAVGQGLDPTQVCSSLTSGVALGAACKGRMGGDLQPYAIYVPKGKAPKGGWGLTLLLHSLSANYNQFATSRNQSQLALRPGGKSIVITPSGRGPDGGYAGIPEADTFETWNTVAHLYKLDPRLTDVSGYSMGGFGTYRLASRWPDLFARAFSVVGAPSPTRDLPSMRNVPLLAWNSTADELVPINDTLAAIKALTADGLRFTEDLFTVADHLTLATNDEYGPGATFFGSHRVNPDPAHVTFVVDPRQDSAAAHVVANHAYWLSGLRLRKSSGDADGTIDVRSEGFGHANPAVSKVKDSTGVLTHGEHVAIPYEQFAEKWLPAAKAKRRDRLDVIADNIKVVIVDVARAHVTCNAAVHIKTNGPVRVVLAGCHRTVRAH